MTRKNEAGVKVCKGAEALAKITAKANQDRQFRPSTADCAEGALIIEKDPEVLIIPYKGIDGTPREYFAIEVKDVNNVEHSIALRAFCAKREVERRDGSFAERPGICEFDAQIDEVYMKILQAVKDKKRFVLKRYEGLSTNGTSSNFRYGRWDSIEIKTE